MLGASRVKRRSTSSFLAIYHLKSFSVPSHELIRREANTVDVEGYCDPQLAELQTGRAKTISQLFRLVAAPIPMPSSGTTDFSRLDK